MWRITITDLKAFLAKLNQNLNILQEREAKYGGDPPLDLLHQIDDHKQAITLTKQAISGDLTETEWRAALQPLLIDIEARTHEAASSVTIGDIEGGIHDSIIAQGDVTVQFITQLMPQTVRQKPLDRNLSAQLAALQRALPALDSANKLAAQVEIEKLEQAIAALPQHEQQYRNRVKHSFAKTAAYFIDLLVETLTTQPSTSLNPDELNSANLARFLREQDLVEYHEWIPFKKEMRPVKLKTLREGVDKYPCIILLGDPGSGKTTALEHLAYQFADQPDKLPLLLRLSEFEPGMSLERFITEGWAGSLDTGHWHAPELTANLEGYLEAGRLLFLFDSLNEMPHQGYQTRVQALRRFVNRWISKGNRFVVTCRVLDYGEELAGLQRIEIIPFNNDQIRALLAKILPERWQSLWRILTEEQDEQRSLLQMARNPFMLNMMVYLFSSERNLNQNRAELMSQFTKILLEWAETKILPDIDIDVVKEALSMLAFEIQARSGFGTTVKTEQVKAVMPQKVYLNPQYPPVPSPPDQVLSWAAHANIIEIPANGSSVRFYHQLLQEYFAAHHMLKQDPKELTDFWRWPLLETEMPEWNRPEGNYDPLPPPPQTGWEETTILAAGLATENDDQLVRALIQVNPVLAGRCLHERRARVGQTIRHQVVKSLLDLIARPEVALQVRIAAGETLGYLGNPHLDEMVVIPAGRFLMGQGLDKHECSLPAFRFGKYPVTNAEYSRFIEAGGYKEKRWWTEAGWETVGQQKDTPWLWQDPRFNNPSQPVVGVSWYECVAYCRWLRAETGQLYRIPTEAEWEKGARGVDGRQYPWGNEFEASRLNADEGAQVVNSITPVGIYPTGVSPYGSFDCAGNVWEWCATKAPGSKLKPYPYDTSEDEWTEEYLQGTEIRALRGGSWDYNRNYAGCAYRHWYFPYYLGFHYWGFRLVSSI